MKIVNLQSLFPVSDGTRHDITQLSNQWLPQAAREAGKSEDPSTQNGAVATGGQKGHNHLVGWEKTGISKEEILKNRELKLQYTIHAEEDAVLKAAWTSTPPLYLAALWAACSHCAKILAACNVKLLVRDSRWSQMSPERWKADITAGDNILLSSGCAIVDVDREELYGVSLRFNGETKNV